MKKHRRKSLLTSMIVLFSAVICSVGGSSGMTYASPEDAQDAPAASPAAAVVEQIRALRNLERSTLPEPPEIKRGPTGVVEIVQLTDATWAEQVEQAEGLVVVCFTARFSPKSGDQIDVLKDLGLVGNFTVLQADMDQCPRTIQAIRPAGFPAIYLYKEGRILTKLNGLQDKNVLKREITAHLQQ